MLVCYEKKAQKDHFTDLDGLSAEFVLRAGIQSKVLNITITFPSG